MMHRWLEKTHKTWADAMLWVMLLEGAIGPEICGKATEITFKGFGWDGHCQLQVWPDWQE